MLRFLIALMGGLGFLSLVMAAAAIVNVWPWVGVVMMFGALTWVVWVLQEC